MVGVSLSVCSKTTHNNARTTHPHFIPKHWSPKITFVQTRVNVKLKLGRDGWSEKVPVIWIPPPSHNPLKTVHPSSALFTSSPFIFHHGPPEWRVFTGSRAAPMTSSRREGQSRAVLLTRWEHWPRLWTPVDWASGPSLGRWWGSVVWGGETIFHN